MPLICDTYLGCNYRCGYCFVRRTHAFPHSSMRIMPKVIPGQALTRNVLFLQGWIDRVFAAENPNSAQIAWRERIPLQIGVNADPFPYQENKTKNTYQVLKILQRYDYPVVLSTKNPTKFLEYAEEFVGTNMVLKVSLISMDQKWLNQVEPHAPKANDRITAIEKLTKMGINVLWRVEPAIFPRVFEDAAECVRAAYDSGCFAISSGQLEYQWMHRKTYDLPEVIHEWYNNPNNIFRMTMHKNIANRQISEQLENVFIDETNARNMAYFCCENWRPCGYSEEHCGSEKLRNYKLNYYNYSSWLYAHTGKNYTRALGNCKSKQCECGAKTKSEKLYTIQQKYEREIYLRSSLFST